MTDTWNSYTDKVQFEALAGGTVNLSGLKTIDTGPLVLESDGANSVLNLAGLTSFTETFDSADSILQASNGGAVDDGNLASLSHVDLNVAGTGEALTLAGLTSYDSGYFAVSGGGTLTLPAPTAFTAMGSFVSVIGAGSSVQIGSGILEALPASGNNGTITVPAFPQGMTVELNTNGTFSGGTTINVGADATLDILGGTYTGGVTFNVGQGALVDLTSGLTVTYGGTLTGSGSGTVLFSSGQLNVALGGLTLNFPESMFQWTGGVIDSSAGDVTNLGNFLAGDNDKYFWDDGTLDNFGTIVQSGSGNLNLHSDSVTATTSRLSGSLLPYRVGFWHQE